ncbi:LytR/AlgR family response regulator transcription factor [Dokdonia sp. Hel_I_53]|uniref:LytR/AlgR family response regulator transcription factor n=1 Tax=Dokdonia sp. Hel_I_53 TaxID=1566287 RepID=UPI001198D9F1|nr:LytTR family DNA-binding domain-containing protein [Dokdonia sp. Hel_I_53]TVZ52361.1 LytTR family two component transcriptional regulator [Dokdonia sp. Hel_I_53]
MELRTILVEDEETSREILRNYLSKYCPRVTIVGEAANVSEALSLLQSTTVDLVFLDVEMPKGNAFDLLEQIADRAFETVFVTAYNQYAMDALNSHAAYYLLKPVSIDELIKAVDIVMTIKKKENELENKVLVATTVEKQGKITIPVQDGFEVLVVKDILYCKADDNYTQIYLNSGAKLLVSKTLKYFENALNNFGFARVHKSYLVNLNEITSYKKGKGGSVVLSGGKEINVSASQKANLLAHFQ